MKYQSSKFELALFCLFFLAAIPFIYATANNDKKKEAYVKFTAVIDNLTKNPIFPSFKVLNAVDSTTVAASYSGVDESFTLTLPDILLDFLVIVKGRSTSLSLETQVNSAEFKADTILITSKQLQDAKGYLTLPPITLKREYARRGVALSEATVVASKVVFYHKGDTLIYNADAFVTPEGSTLDALITQLPGVKIDERGVITANGRKVENLLLNGKDLFNGKGDILLENLPAYTVKDIAVYEKDGELSEFLERKTGDEQYVMDVRLRRDYHAGWIGNAEAGYGTQNKYLAKFFGLLFADNLSLESHFKANNLSDISRSSENDKSWDPSKMNEGVTTSQTGGISYVAKNLPNRWNMRGSVDVQNIDKDVAAGTMRQNYYSAGDIYDYIFNRANSKNLSVDTRHYPTKLIGKKIRLNNMVRFTYSRIKETGILSAASFKEPKDSLFNNIYGGIQDDLMKYHNFITRNALSNYEDGTTISTGVATTANIKTKTTGLGNNIVIYGNLRYDANHFDRFKKYSIEYANDRTDAASQYFKGFPDHTSEYTGSIRFNQFIDRNMPDHVEMSYSYTGKHATTTSNLYLLNNLVGFNWEDAPLGFLPSAGEYIDKIDINQSYSSRYVEDKHNLSIFANKNFGMVRSVFYASADINLIYKNRIFNYYNDLKNSSVIRHSFFPDFAVNLSYNFFDKNISENSKNWNSEFDLKIEKKALEISMLDAVERVNTTDPLYIRMGNPDLKNASNNKIELGFNNHNFRNKIQQNFKFEFRYIIDAIAEARFYNPSTGVTTSRPTNIDGNRSFAVDYGLTTPLFKKTDLTLSSNTTANFLRSRDLSAVIESSDITDNIIEAVNVVNTTSVGEEVKLNYTFGKHSIRAFGKVQYNDYHTHEQHINKFTSWTGNYGVSGVATLPAGFGISSNFTVYTRRGFTDSRLNTSDVVWNARLTKSIMKGSMILAVDAYDMLRQLSNITYTVNAQARTEVVTNVVPAHVLFHVQYRFNRQP